ncbi:hypothetical protein PBI_LUCKY3_9 [Microbacterium phage Lucky3]|uniref:Uncharacterized protein n=2 Tax=Kojivirus golden TaxID=2560590 RepID=A0A2P1CFP7_9CAUD|nr:hypothetical protein FDJ42_gp09 [Microbacterium phage Golden]AVJ49757.1 hypothetical protein PBI_GOLDEN_9 [Microbacterium phage Golden]AVJ50066.1 hypothetical protein PBI_LUCKY3_9 [Microbacterium phage Lucky3]
MAAMEDLEALLQNLPGYSLITVSMKQAALDGALVPDSFLIWPGEEGYEVTYDVYFAALSLLGFLQAQPVIRQSSSEGTSVAVDAPNWGALTSYYRSQSRIVQASGNTVLTRVAIPEGPHVRKTDMSGRGTHYGDVDTDLG